MKISEMIQQLQAIQASHGDLEAACYQATGYEPVKQVAARKTRRRYSRVQLARATEEGDSAAVLFTTLARS